MLKKELISRSPIRVLEKSIHGGLGKGNLGVFTAKKGVGKTACLVHVAMDTLFCDQKVLHISFADDPHHIENWYRQVFHEVASVNKLDNAFETYDEIKQHRLILHFKQPDLSFEKIHEHIHQVTAGTTFVPDLLIIDGLSFYTATRELFSKWKGYADEHRAEIWFSATSKGENEEQAEQTIPAPVKPFDDLFSVVIQLNPVHDYIAMKLLKDHDSKDLEKIQLKLDPKTLLIANHRV